MSKNLFITGTATDVGKTYVSGLITKALLKEGYKAGYFKPLASGNLRTSSGELEVGDVKFVKEISGAKQDVTSMNVYAYERAFSPHLAAKFEGSPPELNKILAKFDELKNEYEYLSIEGCGGAICPLRYDEVKIMQVDLIKALKCPVLIVADAGLGGINAAVLTSKYLREEGIEQKGFVLNKFDESNQIHIDNKFMIQELCALPVLFTITKQGQENCINSKKLAAVYE
ncbi:dethiobiotin synthase [Campylobacter sp. RM9328]|uniref:dethiobiotin synthase n=1 Tax=Campylobacter sp. RM9328 TaxID=1705720 RepID=UPI0014746795|nr:dethiobiotin synthase [Campylobacter sp. RM9328]